MQLDEVVNYLVLSDVFHIEKLYPKTDEEFRTKTVQKGSVTRSQRADLLDICRKKIWNSMMPEQGIMILESEVSLEKFH